MEGSLRRVSGHKKTLDLGKGRMLAEGDSLEVVLDPARDPGADKRGLVRSRPVLPLREDTGGARLVPVPRDSSREGAGIGTAQLI